MEIKIVCPCGTKFKFDVEPVNEHMPWPVSCPACGADGTAAANEIIKQSFAGIAPVAMPVSAAPTPAPQPAGLRISHPAPSATPAAVAPPAFSPAPTRLSAERPKSVSRRDSGWKRGFSILLVVLVIAGVGFKWYWRIKRLARAANAVSQAADDSSLALPDHGRQWNLHADNSVMLIVQHTNHQEIAAECLALWKDKFHQTFKVKKPGSDKDDAGDFFVNASFHGYVVMYGQRDWKEPEFEATAARLSGKFGGLVFLEREISFTGDWLFGVYDRGTNVFHARADTDFNNKELPQAVKVEHQDWALAHGYNPGGKGSKEFDIEDADNLTKACGLEIWSAPDESKDYLILLNTRPHPQE